MRAGCRPTSSKTGFLSWFQRGTIAGMDKRKRTAIVVFAGIGLVAVAVGVAGEFVPPSNLTMSLVEAFQLAVALGLFIWFMNWPRQPTLWELQKKHRQALMERHAGEELRTEEQNRGTSPVSNQDVPTERN